MISRVQALLAAVFLTLAVLPAQAQGLRQGARSAPVLIPRVDALPSTDQTQRPLDFIVAVVNSEPITNYEVNTELQRVLQQFAQQSRPQPDVRELQREILERLVNEKAQLQLAKQTGIKIEQSSVDQAEQTVALQNQIDVAELRRRVVQDGIPLAEFQKQLRDQLTLTRLRERDVEPRVRVTDQEVEQYIKEQTDKLQNSPPQLINLAQVLVAVAESATADQVAALQAKAQRVLERARAGDDFSSLAREFSDAQDRANGGQLGLRPVDRYPPLFIDATESIAEGNVSEVIRSGAGFHVLKVLEKRQTNAPGLPPSTVVQSRSRHILLRPNSKLSESDALDKLRDFRRRIQIGQTDFETLARQNSQDGSAPQGGDLGWSNPGQFVPEFERVLARLSPGQISDPIISRFGVHLIQLLERRNAPLSVRDQREIVRNMLREKKLDETYEVWAQEVRGRAYVELREPPQ
jgi:peptidyl-prolyl cis-trans isomerase SurA